MGLPDPIDGVNVWCERLGHVTFRQVLYVISCRLDVEDSTLSRGGENDPRVAVDKIPTPISRQGAIGDHFKLEAAIREHPLGHIHRRAFPAEMTHDRAGRALKKLGLLSTPCDLIRAGQADRYLDWATSRAFFLQERRSKLLGSPSPAGASVLGEKDRDLQLQLSGCLKRWAVY